MSRSEAIKQAVLQDEGERMKLIVGEGEGYKKVVERVAMSP